MNFNIIDTIIVFFFCVSMIGLFGAIIEIPLFFMKNPEVVVSITNYNNTFTPPIFSFAIFKTNICLTNNINTNNIICNDYIKCPSKMEAGEVYILYCSCDNLSCSFEVKKNFQGTITFWVFISFLGILCISIIYTIFRCYLMSSINAKKIIIKIILLYL